MGDRDFKDDSNLGPDIVGIVGYTSCKMPEFQNQLSVVKLHCGKCTVDDSF